MHIKEKVSQHRRDFTAIYECEFCGATKRDQGYDDIYFHQTVIPSLACDSCGKTGSTAHSEPSVAPGAVL